MRADRKIAHAFATDGRFRTDGKRVMMDMAADDGERRLIDIMTDEFGFPDAIERCELLGRSFDCEGW